MFTVYRFVFSEYQEFLCLQFLLIIRSSSEDSIRAAYATKVAQLVETYAQPAEYARTMAAVLVAAGNAAPKALASRMSATLALCGERAVQANTATVFSQLLKGQDPLSDAQLLVRLLSSVVIIAGWFQLFSDILPTIFCTHQGLALT
jgi:hypothetical protein